MNPEQIKALLGAPPPEPSTTNAPMPGMTSAIPVAPVVSDPLQILPQASQKVMSDLQSTANIGKQRFIESNKHPGVDLDVSTGASPWERFWVGSMRDKENAISYMQQKYGPKNVRLDNKGEIIFRAPDETGKPKDIKFNPMDMSAGDLAALASSFPEAAASVLAIMGGRKIPGVGNLKGLLGVGRDVIAGALGAETTGSAKDIGFDLSERGKTDLGEITKERGKMAGEDVAFGAGTYGAGRFFKFLASPFAGKRGQIQFDMEQARKYFREHPDYNVDIPVTASEATGSPLLGRSEVYTEIQPGGYGPLKELKQQQEQEMLKLQKQMTGISPPPSDEDIARRMETALQPQIAPQEKSVRTAAKGLQEAGEQRTLGIATQLTTPERQLYRDVTGKEVRGAVQAKQQAAMDEAKRLYAAADALGAKDKLIDGADLHDKLRSILKNLPSAETTRTTPTGLLGPTGAPLTTTTTRNELLEKWPPSRILDRVREVLSKPNAKFSISDLKQMRADIYDDLSRGQGVPDLGAHYLSQIGDALTQSIKDGVNALPSGNLKAAMQAADAHWKNKVVPFDRPGITELFRKEGESGFIADDEVISRIFTTAKTPAVSIQNYNLLKETLGANSPQFIKVKRALLDHIIEAHRVGGEFIDPKALAQTLTDLRTNYRTVADDVFGPRLNELFKEAKFMEYGRNPKLAQEDLDALLRDPSPTSAKLKDMVLKQQRLDETYRNSILRDVSKNALNPGSVNPIEFVSRFLENPNTSVSEIQQVLGMLAHRPALLEDIQSKAVENFFAKAGTRIGAGNVSRAFSGEESRVASNAGMVKALQDMGKDGVNKLRALVGDEKFETLRQYANLVSGTEYKYSASGYAMAGAFAATHTVKALEQLKLIDFLKPTLANWFVAKVLTNPVFRQWAGHVPKNPDPGFISLFLSSPSFLKEVAKDFPGNGASAAVTGFKEAMDRLVSGVKQDKPDQPDKTDWSKQLLEMRPSSAPSATQTKGP